MALVAALAADPLILHLVETSKAKGLYGLDGVNVNATTRWTSRGETWRCASYRRRRQGKTVKPDLMVVGKTVYARIGGTKWKKSRRSD